jgi:hypothetical protein
MMTRRVVMKAEESRIMVSAVETVAGLGLAILSSWQAGMDVPVRGVHESADGKQRSVPGVLCENKPGDGRESEAGN